MYFILVKHKREKKGKKYIDDIFEKTQSDGRNSLSNAPVFILSQHVHQINQQKRTVVLHVIADVSGLTDSFKEVY